MIFFASVQYVHKKEKETSLTPMGEYGPIIIDKVVACVNKKLKEFFDSQLNKAKTPEYMGQKNVTLDELGNFRGPLEISGAARVWVLHLIKMPSEFANLNKLLTINADDWNAGLEKIYLEAKSIGYVVKFRDN